jgi:hypothetical protein
MKAQVGTVIALLLLAAGISGCGPEKFSAVWLKPSYVVDGHPDWWNMPAYSEKILSGRLVIANDSSALYLGLYSSDKRLAMRFKGQGLTICLTNPENQRERVGIHYPLGMMEVGGHFRSNRYLPSANLPPETETDMLELQTNDVVITAPDSAMSGRKTPEEAAAIGVLARFQQTESSVQYTLRMKTETLAPWLRPGARVLVEVDSPAMKRPGGGRRGERPPDEEGGGRGGWGRPGGGMGGMGGGPRGGDRGPREGDRDQQSGRIAFNKDLHLTADVTLAETPSP